MNELHDVYILDGVDIDVVMVVFVVGVDNSSLMLLLLLSPGNY